MSETQKRYLRFGISERIEHLVLILSFTTLSVTGLPQKFALNAFSQALIAAMGGIEAVRIIHRVAAAVFLLQAIYHLVMVGYKLFVKRKEPSMLPTIKDAKDAVQWFLYNLGLARERPKMPRYNFMEKAEYWAMVWGLFLMGLTGLMLWNPIATTRLLPGEFIPAAKAAHGAEAVLAVLAIILWHFYNVHIKHFNWSMFRGTLSHHEMVEEHGEELERLESGALPADPPAEVVSRRMRVFAPVAGVVTIALVAATIYFLTFEETAITTVPPVSDVPVFVRPTPTAQPTAAAEAPAAAAAAAWEGGIQPLMEKKCVACHGSMGGFTAETYADVMKAVTPGDPDGSALVQAQLAGDHPGQFTEQELNQVIEWIQAGAPEVGEGGASGESGGGAPASPNSWDGSVAEILGASCAGCHGTMGGYSVESYDAAMEAIEPGNPDRSLLIQVVEAGNHPGSLEEDELTIVREWIQAGAPEQ